MPETMKVLAGLNITPAASHVTVYTAPAGSQVVVSKITICNYSATATSRWWLNVRPNGAGAFNGNYLFMDQPLAPNETIVIDVGITIDDADVISVYSTTNDLRVTVHGTEIT